MIKTTVQALRLPFVTASILPYTAGVLLAQTPFASTNYLLGLGVVIFMHLSANLFNDYADSKSGADWNDITYYGVFGGSKLIQQGVLTEKHYLNAALLGVALAGCAALILSIRLHNISALWLFAIVVILAFGYSQKKVRFSYRKLGEPVIFAVFGPLLVMTGYFIQSRTFFSVNAFVLSLPFGFLITAVLFANEVPDYEADVLAEKYTGVCIIGPERAYLLYAALVVCAYVSLAMALMMKLIGPVSLISCIGIVLAVKAAIILQKNYQDKQVLVTSSKLTIALHTLVGVLIVLDIIL